MPVSAPARLSVNATPSAIAQWRRTRMATATKTGRSTENASSQRNDQSTLLTPYDASVRLAWPRRVPAVAEVAFELSTQDPSVTADASRGRSQINAVPIARDAQTGR